MKILRFDLYRYQILPKDRFPQRELFGDKSIEDILEHKNNILQEKIRETKNFDTPKLQTISKIVIEQEDFLLLRLATGRSLKLETKDFSEKIVDTWPNFFVVFWNSPEKQLLAVQERKEAFQQTEAICNGLNFKTNLKYF